jgi:hypothetical protein
LHRLNKGEYLVVVPIFMRSHSLWKEAYVLDHSNILDRIFLFPNFITAEERPVHPGVQLSVQHSGGQEDFTVVLVLVRVSRLQRPGGPAPRDECVKACRSQHPSQEFRAKVSKPFQSFYIE